MVQVKHTIIVRQSAEKLFATLIDFENCKQWQTEQVIKEWYTPEGPITIGTLCHQQRMFFGKQIESVTEVVTYEPGHKFVTQSLPGDDPSTRVEYLVETVEGGAKLDFTITLRGKGMFKLMTPIIQKSIQKDVVRRSQNLKQLLENGQQIEAAS